MAAKSPAPSHLRQIKPLQWAARLLVAAAHLYCIGVCGWVMLNLLCGDRWWWLFLLNNMAVYLFAPLPLLLALALLTRRRGVWIGFGVVLVLGGYFYGGLLLPRLTPSADSGSTITVMTYNVLGVNMQTEQVVAALRASDADVIALQELNPPIAEAIARDLAAEYPHQALDPRPGTSGMGVISRYPLRPTSVVLPGRWVGTPQVLDLEFGATTVTFVNFHAIPLGGPAPTLLEYTTHEREEQARTLAALTATRPGPLIAPGDFNAADRSTAYAIITGSLVDPWRVAGRGLGHTFPGAASPGSSRPSIGGIPMPMWMVRIDYVFHSDDWQPVAARIGPWDGFSDHRPVVVRLALTGETDGSEGHLGASR